MIEETNVAYSGIVNDIIDKYHNSGKIIPEKENERIKKILEENRKKIQPTYNSKGKRIEYDKCGNLDILA